MERVIAGKTEALGKQASGPLATMLRSHAERYGSESKKWASGMSNHRQEYERLRRMLETGPKFLLGPGVGTVREVRAQSFTRGLCITTNPHAKPGSTAAGIDFLQLDAPVEAPVYFTSDGATVQKREEQAPEA